MYQNDYVFPRKHSFRKRFGRHIKSNCLKQNNLRVQLKNILPATIVEVEDNIYGVDYEYGDITIDQKFSFGDLGENAIKIRTKNRRLLNNSDWTLIINKNEEIELFETKKLAEFVKKNWDLVQRRTICKKRSYNAHIIKMSELYYIEKITPITLSLEKDLTIPLNDLTNQIIDYSKKICLLNLVF
ncbi:MAG: hypothetical protein WC915_00865 [archaeon]|jgi:hypothetical protein